VNMSFPEQPWWIVIGGGSLLPNFEDGTLFTAPSNAATATVRVFVRDVQLDTTFGVKEPSGLHNVVLEHPYTNTFPIGQTGAGMKLLPFIGPADVSFYRVTCMEVGENATAVSGWFTNVSISDLSHIGHGADGPIPIEFDNSWHHSWDSAVEPGPGSPVGYGGGYTWNIPARWWIRGGPTNEMPGWNQVISMDASGAITVTKFGHTVTRNTNDIYTTVR